MRLPRFDHRFHIDTPWTPEEFRRRLVAALASGATSAADLRMRPRSDLGRDPAAPLDVRLFDDVGQLDACFLPRRHEGGSRVDVVMPVEPFGRGIGPWLIVGVGGLAQVLMMAAISWGVWLDSSSNTLAIAGGVLGMILLVWGAMTAIVTRESTELQRRFEAQLRSELVDALTWGSEPQPATPRQRHRPPQRHREAR